MSTSLLVPFGSKKYLLDRVSGAEAAYALHRLRRGYSGPAIRVRRDNDDAETNVFFIGRRVTLNSQVSAGGTFGDWVGANSAYVTKWYDQSGNSNDGTNGTTTEQPRIVNSGTLDVDANGRAQIVFDGSDDNLANADSIDLTSGFEMLLVARTDSSTANQRLLSKGDGDIAVVAWNGAASGYHMAEQSVAIIAQKGSDSIVGARTLFGAHYDGSDAAIRENAAQVGSGSYNSSNLTNNTTLTIGGAAASLLGSMQALVLYTRDLGAQRSIAEQEINRILEVY